jgi:hypothetical protein
MNELAQMAREFFGFGDSKSKIGIILPKVSYNRRLSLRCANYPPFACAISYDDALSAFRIHSLLSSLYGDRVEVISHEQITAGKPNQDLVVIGGPPTNPFTFDLNHKAVIRFGEKNDVANRTIVGVRQNYQIEFDSTEPKGRSITRDYCLIAKTRHDDTTEWVVAGLRAYGQLASARFLGDLHFYRRCAQLGLPTLGDFQLVVRVEVSGRAVSNWTIVDWFPGRAATFDVFVCYNSADREAVRAICSSLIDHDITPWLDEWDLHPGDVWTDELDNQILKCKAAAVFLGVGGFGKWQRPECAALLSQFSKRGIRIVPVLLPGSSERMELPAFLDIHHVADFCKGTGQAMGRLADAIRPDR